MNLNLKNILNKVLIHYPAARANISNNIITKDHNISDKIRKSYNKKIRNKELKNIPIRDMKHFRHLQKSHSIFNKKLLNKYYLKYQCSVGQNIRLSDVPWIQISDTRQYPKNRINASYGLYLVYLFAKDGSKVYLSLNMGIKKLQDEGFNKKGIQLIANYYFHLLRNKFKEVSNPRRYIRKIYLDSTNNIPKGYEYGNIISKVYYKNDGISNTSVEEDLSNMIKKYNTLEKSIPLNDIHPRNKKNDYGARNIIFYGAPGVGKSHLVKTLIGDNFNVFRTTFYPEYDYTDFVGQIMPKSNNSSSVKFSFEAGPFSYALLWAFKHPGMRTYLVIEEISRANASAVFGDIFQLLDLDDSGKSEFPIVNVQISNWLKAQLPDKVKNGNKYLLHKLNEHEIYLPNNFYIYATANLDDQNVHPMDSAFQRRFSWKYISTSSNYKSDKYKDIIFTIDNITTNWVKFYQALNSFITKYSNNEDKQIGRFFIKFKGTNEKYSTEYNKQQIQDKLLRYLWSNFQNNDLLMSSSNNSNKSLLNSKINSFEDLNKKFNKSFQSGSTSNNKRNSSNHIFSTNFDNFLSRHFTINKPSKENTDHDK